MELKKLCLSLAKVNTEREVINILKQAGYWDDPDVWRYYGDNENNFATIGNQQSAPDAALVEKIVNSVDAVLMRECSRKKIDPNSNNAPFNTKEALKELFGIYEGILSSMRASSRRKLAENILLIATGSKNNPSYEIIDRGEGQTPNRMPKTFLSLAESNKLRIRFVQGKFNMGGTGALRFCGEHNIQLIISKRDPLIAKYENDETKDYWGFTVVKRENPEEGKKSSAYKYLAPNGKILMFKAKNLPLLPGDYPITHKNPIGWGSFLKLYEYQLVGLKTLITFNLYNRLSLLLPNIALPVRLYERRKGYTGHTFETTLSGLSVRLDEDKRENLEDGFPSSAYLKVKGQEMKISIYAFKKGKKENYSRNEGIMFSVNGQAHGFILKPFFGRSSVGMTYLKDSILLLVDCTDFDGRAREDLFMNSRDRLSDIKLKKEIEQELEELVKKHPGLKALRERRIRELVEGKLGDSKPLLDTIEKIIERSPTLSKLFIKGVKLPNPFDLRGVKEKEKFIGKKYPTYFKLIEDYPKNKPKQCSLNRKFKVQFETDAENEYFTRDSCPGEFYSFMNESDDPIEASAISLWNGLATLTIKPPDKVNIGDIMYYECEVDDINHTESICNEFYLEIIKPQKESSVGSGERVKPPSEKTGKGRDRASHLDLPKVIPVRRNDWEKHTFNKESALSVKHGGEELGYQFYVNMDNIHLQTEIKGKTSIDPKLLEAQYEYGMVLIGLALLKEFEFNNKQFTDKDEDVDNKIKIVTRAISPFLLPMISSLGDLDIET